jgi:hypothetical protein
MNDRNWSGWMVAITNEAGQEVERIPIMPANVESKKTISVKGAA